jgi:hypothetical protein
MIVVNLPTGARVDLQVDSAVSANEAIGLLSSKIGLQVLQRHFYYYYYFDNLLYYFQLTLCVSAASTTNAT